MKHSKSSTVVIGLCLALFAVGCYLKFSNQSEKIKTERRLKAATRSTPVSPGQVSSATATPVATSSPNSETSPVFKESPAPDSAAALKTEPAGTSIRDSNASAPSAGSSGISPQKNDRVRMNQLMTDVKKSIPSVDHLRSLSEADTHETPREIQNAAIEMGRLSEAFEKHPELSSEAEQFYGDCALDPKYPSSIRASCYLDLARQYKKLGKSMDTFAGDREVPSRIKEMAKSML